MNQDKVSLAIESICNTGCCSVNAIIEILEAGQVPEAVKGFSEQEITILKIELKAIMAVYENRD